MKALANRTAIITGASTGLGREMAIMLARSGAQVAIAARNNAKLVEVCKEIASIGGQSRAYKLDVRDVDQIQKTVRAVESDLGHIDILVNNAGVTVAKRPEDFTEEDYNYIVDTNIKGSWFLAQAVGKAMIARRKGGKIINMSSLLALRPLGQLTLYGMTKAAVTQMTKQLALEWARHNIQVNAICPGYIETEMNRAIWKSAAGEKLLSKFVNRRVGTADVLEGSLLLLASDRSDFITGSIIAVDDGQSLG